MSDHYEVLVAGESGNEWPMFSVGCICGDFECDDYMMRREPHSEEQKVIRDAAISEVLEQVVEALEAKKVECLEQMDNGLTPVLKMAAGSHVLALNWVLELVRSFMPPAFQRIASILNESSETTR